MKKIKNGCEEFKNCNQDKEWNELITKFCVNTIDIIICSINHISMVYANTTAIDNSIDFKKWVNIFHGSFIVGHFFGFKSNIIKMVNFTYLIMLSDKVYVNKGNIKHWTVFTKIHWLVNVHIDRFNLSMTHSIWEIRNILI